MKLSILAFAGAALLAASASAFAVGLTDADHDYLATHGVERDSSVLRGLSPREQARLHALINDAATANNTAARAGNVGTALQEFREHEAWEQAHPGELWDVPRPRGPPGG